jgi:hypothetical protein
MGVADDDAFSGGEAIGFDDYGDAVAAELVADFVEGGADGVGGGGYFVEPHEFFGEGFAGLEFCGVLGGAEDAVAALLELVDDAEGERQLGAHDGEGGAFTLYGGEELGDVADIDGHAAGESCDASVAGGTDDFGDARGFSERPDQRVLAPAATDD